MSAKNLFITMFLVAVVATTGCPGGRTAPVYNIDNTPISSMSNRSLSSAEVMKAIKRAGLSLGWRMAEKGPGKLEGTLHVRKHMAKVEIPYSRSGYSIIYKDSQELNYDGANIHSNYNGWIQNLDRAIQSQLSAL
ncbi:MAG TPA: hypothetical protein EYH06_05330 [Chromatiales bacterium]|nr:hypothetical protein [Thiotrichales bacterium]HIP68000.1 hypothetical protein [Chromatiales bacterium]